MHTFNDLEKEGLLKTIVGKGENAGNQHFLLFPHVFSPSQNKFCLVYFLSANAFNLDQSKKFLFGKELTPRNTTLTFNNPEKEALWKKEKMLVTSIFYFSHSFLPFQKQFPVLQLHLLCCLQMLSILTTSILLHGKDLTHFHTMMPFHAPGKQAFRKHWEKEKS